MPAGKAGCEQENPGLQVRSVSATLLHPLSGVGDACTTSFMEAGKAEDKWGKKETRQKRCGGGC